MRDGRARSLLSLIRNLLLAAILYAAIFSLVEVIRNPAIRAKSGLHVPSPLKTPKVKDPVETTNSGDVKVNFAGFKKTLTINPHANVFNRPFSAVVPRDDYLGERPHVDTEANLPLLVKECRGSYDGIEKMRNVFDCLKFLADDEKRYYSLPEKQHRASSQNPREAEYVDADGHGNTLQEYVHPSKAQLPTNSSMGVCPGPIVPYHVYWTGPASWRVEIFVKSYLHTQNLACSRLWIWLDADRHPNAVDDMLHRDPIFARFLPLVERGDITLKSWYFPHRIPLPKEYDNTDGVGYYKTPGKPNSKGESAVADGIVEDSEGQQWLVLTPKQMTFLPVAVSDALRFVVLHVHGGVYFDMDVVMLRDMRPLVLPSNHSFAERWAAHSHPGDYNTAIMSLKANSSLSSYLLRGGVRMGLNFHPRVIGRMAWKDGRDQEFLMLETAAFDPIWTEFNWAREGRCAVPCFKDYSQAFRGKVIGPGSGWIKNEWESYDGPEQKKIEITSLKKDSEFRDVNKRDEHLYAQEVPRTEKKRGSKRMVIATQDHATAEFVPVREVQAITPPEIESTDSFATTNEEEEELRKAGIIAEYDLEMDQFPPNNRTMENFFRGAWTYHIHNQWLKHPEPSSWFDIIEKAHDGFFDGSRANMYGEKWTGPPLARYNRWPEFI